MKNENSHSRPKSTLFPLLVVLTSTLVLAAPGRARPIPWVGVSPARTQFLTEEIQGLHGPFALDYFGGALASGDFNADGADDLATGIPGNDCGDGLALDNCGAVQVRMGLPGLGLTSAVFVLSPENSGTPAPAEANARAGYALAAGDFNGDGHADLAVSKPGNGSPGESGSVSAYYGYPNGIELVADHVLAPGAAGLPAPGPGNTSGFGNALAVGNFNCDLFDDLAVGFPGDAHAGPAGTRAHAGSVMVANGGNGGLMPFDGYRIKEGEEGLPDEAESGDRFGSAVAAGDFNGDGCDDLAIGAPNEDDCGAVLVLFGSPNGLIFANNYWLGEAGHGGNCESGDHFAATLAAGDLNGDQFDDLVIGVPDEDGNDGEVDMGMLGLVYGAPGSPLGGGGGLNIAAWQWWWESLLGANSHTRDRFAGALTTGDFDADGYDDLVVGTPGNDSFTEDDGAVHVLAGNPGLIDTRYRRFVPRSGGVPGPLDAQSAFGFGANFGVGDFDGNGQGDLVIGEWSRDTVALDDGAALVLYGHLFLDGFESGNRDAWSSSVN